MDDKILDRIFDKIVLDDETLKVIAGSFSAKIKAVDERLSLQNVDKLLKYAQNAVDKERKEYFLLSLHAVVHLRNRGGILLSLAKAFLDENSIKLEDTSKITLATFVQSINENWLEVTSLVDYFFTEDEEYVGRNVNDDDDWREAKQQTLSQLQTIFEQQGTEDLNRNAVLQSIILNDTMLRLAKRKRRRQQLLFGVTLLLLTAGLYMLIDSFIYAHGAGFAPFGLWVASSASALPIVVAAALMVCSIALLLATIANAKPEWFRCQQKSNGDLNTPVDLAHNAYQPLSQHAAQIEKVKEPAPKNCFTKLFSCCHKPSGSSESKTPLLGV